MIIHCIMWQYTEGLNSKNSTLMWYCPFIFSAIYQVGITNQIIQQVMLNYERYQFQSMRLWLQLNNDDIQKQFMNDMESFKRQAVVGRFQQILMRMQGAKTAGRCVTQRWIGGEKIMKKDRNWEKKVVKENKNEQEKTEVEVLTMMTATQPETRVTNFEQCAHSSTFYHLTTTASTPSWLMDIATRIRLLGHLFWNLNDIETSCKLLGWKLQSLRKTGKDHFQRETERDCLSELLFLITRKNIPLRFYHQYVQYIRLKQSQRRQKTSSG